MGSFARVRIDARVLTRFFAVLVVFGLSVYFTVVVPTLRTIVTPLPEDTRQDRVEAMQVLSAGNIIIMGCLGLVLLLQVGAPPSLTERRTRLT